jgi:cytochrome c oxidase subunit 1
MFIKSLARARRRRRTRGARLATSGRPPRRRILHNFHEQPVMTRGPYDYHLATDEELFDGFPEDAETTKD